MWTQNKIRMPVLFKNHADVSWIFDDLDISRETRKDYTARIPMFLSHIRERGLNMQSYLAFKHYLQERGGYSIATRNKYLITARIFLKQLVRRGMLPIDITQGIKCFRQSKRHKRQGVTDKEIKLLGIKLKHLPNTPQNSRLKALFSLLAYQGLRQVEITRLNVGDIDLRRKTALIQGKGQDDKEVIYLTPATVTSLKEHLKDHIGTSEALFMGVGNRKSERISTMTIKREMGRILRELGIEKSVHGFRHFYVTELLKTMDLRDTRKFSRHRSVEMLLVYDDEMSLEHKAQHVFRVMEKFNYQFT